MAREELAVFTNMCMLCDDAGRVLAQRRRDPAWPGVCFPGGHVEAGESFVHSVVREMAEETGLHIATPRLCGVKQFQTQAGARYVVLLYRSHGYTGTLRPSDEGEVFWVPLQDLPRLDLASGFAEMLQIFCTDQYSECQYVRRDGALETLLL